MTSARRDGSRAGQHTEAGFSLVEVMAALVILAIAMTAVFATFISQQKSFTVQSRVAEMQQNLRQAVEYMSRDIRMAGYGIPDNVVIPAGIIATGVTSIRSVYVKDNTTGPDQIYILYLFDMDLNQPPTTSNNAAANATSITVVSTTGFLAGGGELVLITDGNTADLYETSSGTSGTTMNFRTGIAGYNGFHSKFYPAASTVAKARFERYYIDSTTDSAHPTLMVDRMGGLAPQPVADDIEDMQLSYGLDTNNDGVVDAWRNDVVGGPVLSVPAEVPQIRQVRLQFIARTRLPGAGWAETRPVLGNHAAGATPDGHRRRIYDIVIDVRNSGV